MDTDGHRWTPMGDSSREGWASVMRVLGPPPDAVVDPVTGTLRCGSFRGPLPPVDLRPLGRDLLSRAVRRKRWLWGTIVSDEALLGFAVVDLGWLASTFAFAWDRRERRMLVDRSALGPGFRGLVNDRAEDGCEARFGGGRTRARVARRLGTTAYEVDVELGELRIEATLESASAPPPLSAIVELPPDAVATTQKRALLAASGRASVGERTFALDGAVAGLDYSHGYPPRRTIWKWCFALGRARSGEPIGVNVVQGFVGEPECVVWVGDDVHPVGEGHFEFDRGNLLAPWRIRTTDGAVELKFAPGGMHREEKNFGVIASHFVQAAGTFDGTIALPGRAALELDGVAGVAEDQDMLW
ncbi:MAG: DUF2804 domain-containing protein [Deltaproteobacteria bacterium]|nr:DUF2804 domain-containing protein [Deltaproteobacteria bacterium]